MARSAAIAAPPAEAAVPRRALGQRILRARWPYLFISPFFVWYAVFGLYPLLFSVYLSFTEWTGLGPLRFNGLANFELLLKDKVFWRAMSNGVILFFMYVPLMILLALVLAVILNSRRIRGFQYFRAVIFLPYITNMVAAGFAFRLLMSERDGLFNVVLRAAHLPAVPWLESVWGARVSLCLLIIWGYAGYHMVIMLAGLQTIPRELTEAALIDGASPAQAFFFITIPLLRPVILFSVVLSTMGSFDLFPQLTSMFQSTVGRGPLNATVTPIVAIFDQALRNFRFGYASAMSYVYFAMVFVLTLIQVRYFGREDSA